MERGKSSLIGTDFGRPYTVAEEENTIQIEVMVTSEDMAKVIGHEGRTINAVRTIVQAASFNGENKLIKIREFKGVITFGNVYTWNNLYCNGYTNR